MRAFSHVSPWAMVPSCMSSSRFGTTSDTVGRRAKSRGNAANVALAVAGSFV